MTPTLSMMRLDAVSWVDVPAPLERRPSMFANCADAPEYLGWGLSVENRTGRSPWT